MDKIAIPESRIGNYLTIPSNGGMITVRERPVLDYAQKSLVQNMRCWHPGFETRDGYIELHSTPYNAGAESILNMYQFAKGKTDERRFFVQFGDGDLQEAINDPPATGTDFGVSVFSGGSGQLPAAFANINDYMIYSQGVDQHQIYAGEDQNIEAFIFVSSTTIVEPFPDVGIDYSLEVTDRDSTTVADIGTLSDNQYDAVYIMTKTPLDKLNLTIPTPAGSSKGVTFEYWGGSWESLPISVDGTNGLTQSGTITFTDTAPTRTDEIPRYMFHQSGFWYKMTIVPNVFNFFTFVENDNPTFNRISVAADQITFTGMESFRPSACWRDEGAGSIGDFEYDFSIAITSMAVSGCNVGLFGVSNTTGTLGVYNFGVAQLIAANDGIMVYARHAGSGVEIVLEDFSNSNQDTYLNGGTSMSQHWLTLERSGTTATCTIYTDSNRTNILDTLSITCEAGTKRYLHCVTGFNTGSSAASSGYVKDLGIGVGGTGILDITTFTEVDPGAALTLDSTGVTWTAHLASEANYAYNDEGAGNIGDFAYSFDVNTTSIQANGSGIGLFAVSNTIGDMGDMDTADDGIVVYFVRESFVNKIKIKDFSNDNEDEYSTGGGGNLPQRWLTVERSGTTATCKIYSDAARTTLIDTLSITCETGTKRYLYATVGGSGGTLAAISGRVQNFFPASAGGGAVIEVSDVTYDCESFVDLVNVFNGVPIDLIEAQLFTDVDSVWDTYGAAAITLDDFAVDDELYLSSTEQLEAIYFDVGDTPNKSTSAVMSIEYWNGSSWQSTTLNDGTNGLTETGWAWFGRQTDETKRQFRDTRYFAYWYRIKFDTVLSADVVVNALGMPYYNIAKLGSVGNVSGAWKNRGLYTFSKFPRDIYVSQAGDHMMLNGTDFAILQPGDGRDNATVAIVNFHNEIMVFQEEKGAIGGCVTLFEGYSPATFGKLVLSTKIGSFSPKSVDVVDGSKTSLTKKDMNSQTMVFFLSHYGVFMSDGRVVTGISDDIQNYFDERFEECIRRGYEKEMWLKYDSTENLIKIGIVSGPTAEKCNKFFQFDLTDGVWYEDVYADSLSVFEEVEASSGQFHILQVAGGSDSGLVYQMNTGDTDNGEIITWKLVWELSKGPWFTNLNEVLTKFKVSPGDEYTIQIEETDVKTYDETGGLDPYATNETLIRNRHLSDVEQRCWDTVTLTGETHVYLYSIGLIASIEEYK